MDMFSEKISPGKNLLVYCTKNAACFECFENYYVSFKEMIEQELFPLSQECGSDEPFNNMR